MSVTNWRAIRAERRAHYFIFPNDYPPIADDILKANCKRRHLLFVCKFRDSDTIYHFVEQVIPKFAYSSPTQQQKISEFRYRLKKIYGNVQKFGRIIREFGTFKCPSFHSGRFDEREKLTLSLETTNISHFTQDRQMVEVFQEMSKM